MKQKRDRYEMHKYWGKKPSSNLGKLVREYSKEGDIVLDPFSGYGVFCCEAFISNRNVIANDLNPVANFLNLQLLEKEVDIEKVKKYWFEIKSEFVSFVNGWFEMEVDSKKVQLISILRNNSDIPIKAKYKAANEKKAREFEISKADALSFLEYEKEQEITDWYPDDKLIENSRISAKKGMTISLLFTKRTLSCHAKLFDLIQKHSSGKEKNLLMLAFTANLANCSKLVPPIKSRGDMAPGAWMTGFYTGETYIENNVLIYFENRLNKALKGKVDYLSCFSSEDSFNNVNCTKNIQYKITQDDAKNLNLEDESVDYIFADPPYGEAVPYFEQSIIWNSWLKLLPDYENEIVISDSKERNKTMLAYENDINLAFSEISRVLKPNRYFSLTYHSLSGLEWRAITNACIRNGFQLHKFEWLVQKSFTPRQINRIKSIKGDVLVTFKKLPSLLPYEEKTDAELHHILTNKIRGWLNTVSLDTNQIFLKVMEIIFKERLIIGSTNLLDLLLEEFELTDKKYWIVHDECKLQSAR